MVEYKKKKKSERMYLQKTVKYPYDKYVQLAPLNKQQITDDECTAQTNYQQMTINNNFFSSFFF